MRSAGQLSTKDYVDLFEVTKDYNVTEMYVPKKLIGKSLKDVEFNKRYNFIVLTKLKKARVVNKIRATTTTFESGDIVTADIVPNAEDIIVVCGRRRDIERMIEDNN